MNKTASSMLSGVDSRQHNSNMRYICRIVRIGECTIQCLPLHLGQSRKHRAEHLPSSCRPRRGIASVAVCSVALRLWVEPAALATASHLQLYFRFCLGRRFSFGYRSCRVYSCRREPDCDAALVATPFVPSGRPIIGLAVFPIFTRRPSSRIRDCPGLKSLLRALGWFA